MDSPYFAFHDLLVGLRSRMMDTNNNEDEVFQKRRCLFGKPDPRDTEALKEEQYARDKDRFLRRFSVDIDEIGVEDQENVDPGKTKCKHGSKKRHSRAFKPYNQAKITDHPNPKKAHQKENWKGGS